MFEINGVSWDIKFVNPKNSTLKRANNTYAVGVTDLDTRTIYISNEINGYFLRKVLIHEITHCVCFSLNIYLDIYQEEQLCDFVATYSSKIINLTDNLLREMGK